MKRSLFGLLPLAVVMALGSCSGDPTGDLQGDPTAINATPTILNIDAGGTELIDVQLVDAQGNPLAANFSFAVGNPAVVSVVEDTTYRPGLGGEALTQRFSITALSTDSTSVTFTGRGFSRAIKVSVIPLSLAATFSATPPGPNQPATITMPAGLKLLPSATITTSTGTAINVVIAADSGSATFVPIPSGGASTGPVVVTGIGLSYLPGVPLTLTTTANFAAPPGYAGADAFATAPVLALPAESDASYLDAGPFYAVAECTGDIGGPCRLYRFDVAATDTITFTSTWQGTTDIGLYFYDATPAILGSFGCDAHGNGVDGQPETCTHIFTPGTYYVAYDDFGPFYPEAPPTNFRIDVSTVSPAP
jgi:hypothetical protein